jgi:hypothetical protein
MTAQEIAAAAAACREAGCTTVLQAQIAAELLIKPEITLKALANKLSTPLELIAHAAATMETAGGTQCTVTRQALGYSILRLSPTAQKTFMKLISI